ncbi:hypothetical protein D4R89_08370 [bacterium]|nr:MAG: hypothetical protein D4R89_08370 [bacterium]
MTDGNVSTDPTVLPARAVVRRGAAPRTAVDAVPEAVTGRIAIAVPGAETRGRMRVVLRLFSDAIHKVLGDVPVEMAADILLDFAGNIC